MKPINRYFLRVVNNFCKKLFGDRVYFGCIYGSRANGEMNKNSDIDVFVAVEEYSQKDLELFKKFIIDLHKKHKIPFDAEVPYDNKLLISYKEAEKSTFLCGLNMSNNKFSIPSVKKTKRFLNSIEIRRRLFFNALTTPHAFFGNDRKRYTRLSTTARENAILLAVDLLGETTFTLLDLVEKLLIGHEGEKEDYYLGYKCHKASVNHLRKLLRNALQSLINCKEVSQNGKFFSLAQGHSSTRILKKNFLCLKNE